MQLIETLEIVTEELFLGNDSELVAKYIELINLLRGEVLVNQLNPAKIESEIWNKIRSDRSLLNLTLLMSSSFELNYKDNYDILIESISNALLPFRSDEDETNIADEELVTTFGTFYEYKTILTNDRWLIPLIAYALNIRILFKYTNVNKS